MSNWNIISVETCDSTNNLTKNLRMKGEIDNRSVIMAGFQESGRGQGKNTWHSEPGQNMLCSFYIKPNLHVERHFLLNIAVSLAICEMLKEYKIESQIKWPNDIYVDNKKIAGILIENSLLDKQIVDSIIGIGLNVNQVLFPGWIPNPVSVVNLLNSPVKIEEVISKLTCLIDKYQLKLNDNTAEELFHQYVLLLYKCNVWSLFESNGHTFNGQIHGIMPDGRLLIETEGGQMKHFLFGEVKFVL
jgi:BirA family transcriptional regulator, biotin operon repressor / biotin---[acetyl-CoA-carboxylase] ligase